MKHFQSRFLSKGDNEVLRLLRSETICTVFAPKTMEGICNGRDAEGLISVRANSGTFLSFLSTGSRLIVRHERTMTQSPFLSLLCRGAGDAGPLRRRRVRSAVFCLRTMRWCLLWQVRTCSSNN